jgi:peroxiredoxin
MSRKILSLLLPAILLPCLALTVVDVTRPATAPATKPADAKSKPPAKGDTAKSLSLKTLADKEISLAELKKTGPVIIVQLRGWVGYQCPLCTKQVADLTANAKEFAAKKATVILVYPGPASVINDKAKDFEGAKNLPENFHFVLDPDLKFVKEWNLHWDAKNETAYPATFIVDKDNKIAYAKVSTGHGDRAKAADLLKALP